MFKEDSKIILVDKPAGITSFDVIRRLRRRLGIKKMGHSGTLDPFATGLLLIGVNEGTKDLSKLIKLDKEYIAEIILGIQTDTGDITGKKLVTQSAIDVSDLQIHEAVARLIGSHEYKVPKYSAIKVDGKRLYELARNNIEFDAPVKTMVVHSASIVQIERQKDMVIVTTQFDVASGTYIRTLGEEIGRILGVPATLQNLRRTKVGIYSIEDESVIQV
jgi:tRNA pseudouridine55 synthase